LTRTRKQYAGFAIVVGQIKGMKGVGCGTGGGKRRSAYEVLEGKCEVTIW
jgi:hypothetical protein